MTVHPLDEHGLPVHQKLAVLDFDFPESHFYGYDFADGAAVLQCDHEGVKVRSLCRPFMRVLHRHGHRPVSCSPYLFRANGFPVGIKQFKRNMGFAFHVQTDIQCPVLVPVVQAGSDPKVFYPLGVAHVEVTVA